MSSHPFVSLKLESGLGTGSEQLLEAKALLSNGMPEILSPKRPALRAGLFNVTLSNQPN
jgi:hypothetical protein